jgi:hypothetical protein
VSDAGVVILRDGRQYSGAVEVGPRHVCCTGGRRVREGERFTSRGADGKWCWPWARIREIRWEAAVRELAA